KLLRVEEPALPGGDAYDPGDIVDPEDLRAEVAELYETGRQAGLETQWRGLADLYTVKPSQWTVITGTPGSGKSAWLDNLMVHFAEEYGWKWGVFTAEN